MGKKIEVLDTLGPAWPRRFVNSKNRHEAGPDSSDFNDVWTGLCSFSNEDSESGLRMAPKGSKRTNTC